MISLSRSGFGLLLTLLSVYSCGESDEERPPGIEGESQGAAPKITRSAQGGSAGAPAKSPEPDEEETEEETEEESPESSLGGPLEGSVRQYKTDAFEETKPYEGAVTITIMGAQGVGGIEYQSLDGSFSLPEDSNPGELWMLAEPDDDASLLPTLSLQTIGSTKLELPLMPEDLLGEVLATTAAGPVTSPSAGHLLLRVLDAEEVPLAGVRVFAEGGPDYSYASGNSWSEFRDNTAAEGLVLFYNMPASSFPGDEREVTLAGAVEQEFSVRIVAGMVTVVTVSDKP